MSASARRFVRVRLTDGREVFASLSGDRAEILDDAPWRGGQATGEGVSLEAAQMLAPVQPSKILCVGRNYLKHAQELDHPVPPEPLLFFKPPSSIIGPGGEVELPPASISTRVEHEVELGVVIGQRTRRVTPDEARTSIFGLTLVADVTARDLQKKDGQWTRAKGMDTFCPVGPAIVTGLSPDDLTIVGRVNGATRQRGTTRDMIFSVPDVIAYASQVMTLEPGDLIATGTPEGVGPLVADDSLEIEVAEIGVLSVRVVASAAP